MSQDSLPIALAEVGTTTTTTTSTEGSIPKPLLDSETRFVQERSRFRKAAKAVEKGDGKTAKKDIQKAALPILERAKSVEKKAAECRSQECLDRRRESYGRVRNMAGSLTDLGKCAQLGSKVARKACVKAARKEFRAVRPSRPLPDTAARLVRRAARQKAARERRRKFHTKMAGLWTKMSKCRNSTCRRKLRRQIRTAFKARVHQRQARLHRSMKRLLRRAQRCKIARCARQADRRVKRLRKRIVKLQKKLLREQRRRRRGRKGRRAGVRRRRSSGKSRKNRRGSRRQRRGSLKSRKGRRSSRGHRGSRKSRKNHASRRARRGSRKSRRPSRVSRGSRKSRKNRRVSRRQRRRLAKFHRRVAKLHRRIARLLSRKCKTRRCKRRTSRRLRNLSRRARRMGARALGSSRSRRGRRGSRRNRRSKSRKNRASHKSRKNRKTRGNSSIKQKYLRRIKKTLRARVRLHRDLQRVVRTELRRCRDYKCHARFQKLAGKYQAKLDKLRGDLRSERLILKAQWRLDQKASKTKK